MATPTEQQPRIIKHGVVPPPRGAAPLPQIACPTCGCIFTYRDADKFVTGSGNADWYAVKCMEPACGHHVPISHAF